MATIEFTISNQKFLLKSEDGDEHLSEVAQLVKRKVENIRKKSPSLSLHKAVMLSAVDFASQVIKGRKRALDYQSEIVSRANALLKKVETEIETPSKGLSLS